MERLPPQTIGGLGEHDVGTTGNERRHVESLRWGGWAVRGWIRRELQARETPIQRCGRGAIPMPCGVGRESSDRLSSRFRFRDRDDPIPGDHRGRSDTGDPSRTRRARDRGSTADTLVRRGASRRSTSDRDELVRCGKGHRDGYGFAGTVSPIRRYTGAPTSNDVPARTKRTRRAAGGVSRVASPVR